MSEDDVEKQRQVYAVKGVDESVPVPVPVPAVDIRKRKQTDDVDEEDEVRLTTPDHLSLSRADEDGI